ncbi:unnamed protein product [Arctia plantaginis]|uniref:Reverse transcriptase n=1 Tax=Arctia plantaginis TaxID=874455 RepID=A0A8S1AUT6_ARCPL|nr:unnamed protein product [Arctia plantaginis]
MEGLEFSVAKTQFMTLNNPRSDDQPISINGQVITKCEEYKYLGNILHSSGDLEHNIQQSIAAAWLKLREITGVTCDKKMGVKLKGLFYKAIIMAVLMYGSETWAPTQRHVHAIHVVEMKMLR